MTDTFTTPDDDGPIKASDFTTSWVDQAGERAAQAFHELPVSSLVRAARQAHASGEDLAVGSGGELDTFGNVPVQQQQDVIDRQKAAIPDISQADAKALLKQEGLSESDVPLGSSDSHKLPVLKMRIEDAHAQRDREAAIERGPQGFFPTALGFVTSLGVGMVDPINLAAFSIPVIGEARMGKILASAGGSMLGRAAVRAGEGAAKGAAGTTALQPLDWWLHSHDGHDYTMSEAMQSIVMGAGMGAAFHALPGAWRDWRARRQGLPLEGTALDRVLREMPRIEQPEPPAGEAIAHPEEEVPGISPKAPAAAETAAAPQPEATVPTPGEVLADLPQAVRQDAVHSAMAALIEGKPVQTAEILDIAASHDPRIAETIDPWNEAGEAARAEPVTPYAARQAVADDVRDKLRAAGLSDEEADANAAVTAARYNARAARLGTGQNALDLYRGENLSIRNDEFGFPGEAGRAFNQSQPQAPAFYSAVDRAVTSAKQDKASPEQWLGTLKNAGAVKAEEMKWLGLEDWLKQQQGSVTKQQVQDFVRANAIEVKEVAKELPDETYPVAGGAGTKYSSYVLPGGENYREMLLTLPSFKSKAREAFFEWQNKPENQFEGTAIWRQANPELAETMNAEDFKSSHWEEPNVLAHIRFDDRISDGKKTLHVAEVQSDWHQAGKRKGYDTRPNLTEDQRAALVAERGKIVSDATDAKTEIEARYGAEFERRGLREASMEEKKAFWEPIHDELAKDPREIRYSERINEINAALGEHQFGTVPDAPFKTTWPELSMKRMIRYAAEHGYDRISWDTGATNAERYDLSKRIQTVRFDKFGSSGSTPHGAIDSDTRGMLTAFDHNGEQVLEKHVDASELPDIIGKDAAEKLLAAEGKRSVASGTAMVRRKLEGLELKVGGEGMAGFYDKILPATVNRLVKKFGAKVEEGRVSTGVGKDERWVLRDATDQGEGEIVSSHATRAEAEREAEDYGGGVEVRELPVGDTAVHSLDITPDLRKAAMQQGFPLFQGGGDNPRGRITLNDNAAIIDLFRGRDASTFMHESGHLWLDELLRDADHPAAPAPLRADRDAVLNWLGVKDASEIGTREHEKWAEGFENYLSTGEAPSSALAQAFEAFKRWIGELYRALSNAGEPVPREIRGVMDRMLATDAEIADRGDELNASTKEARKATPRGRAAADPQTWSLFEYLASKGGLKPDPELRAIFGGARGPMIGGFGPLLRNNGMALDEALRVAKEGHYLFDAGDVSGAEASLTPRDLLDMVDRESRSRKVYRMDHVTPDREIAPEEEEKHIVDALHDELEAASGRQGIEIDPKLEARVVEIIRHEGEHDVLSAFERAIMEDEERYDAAVHARAQSENPADRTVPGWDAAAEPGAAPPGRAAAAPDRRAAGRARPADGGGAGGEPRPAGAGDRAPRQAELAPRKSTPAEAASDPRWRELSEAKADYDDPETLAESEAAAKLPEPTSTEDPAKSLTALEKAAADAEEIWKQLEPTLTEAERAVVNDVMDQLKLDAETRNKIISDGAACLAGAIA